MKKKLLIIGICAAAVLLIALVGILGYLLPYQGAETAMAENTQMVLTRRENGTLALSWTEAPAQYYRVQVLQDGSPIFTQDVQGAAQCDLPELPMSEELTLQINSVGTYSFLFESEPRLRLGDVSAQVTGVLNPPVVEALTRQDDSDNDTVTLGFAMEDGMACQLFRIGEDGALTLLQTTEEDSITIAFGREKDFPVPAYGEEYAFTLSCSRELPGITLRGSAGDRITVCREDLLGTKLNFHAEDEDNNRYMLYWDETKGDHYLLQQWDAKTKDWKTIREYDKEDTLAYDTGHLPRYSEFTYRLVGVGGQTLPGSEYSTEPEEVSLTTGASVVYSTIWPIQKLDVYDQPGGEIIGSVPEAKAFCVLDLQVGMFQIRYDGEKTGYIDSNYCMINLPEYIGDKCLYNISNSFESRYMIHNYAIPEVTDKITVGYEKVQLADKSYLVPLLFPTAQKLEKAAFAAMEQGYKLMIYDSYRPRKATLKLYDIATALLKEPLPAKDYYEEDGENAGLTGAPNETPVTYEMLMTDNGRYHLGYFLANGGSRHNMGVAMDLTLVKLRNNEEVEMQSKMHDLSWYSEVKQNNSPAWVLYNIMTGAEFTGLSSEWWHYQDNDAIDGLKLTNFMYEGVNAECWMADDQGWRYRRTDGRFYTDCTRTIGDVTYVFDANGYVTEG